MRAFPVAVISLAFLSACSSSDDAVLGKDALKTADGGRGGSSGTGGGATGGSAGNNSGTGGGSGGYDPCSGKVCGEMCNLCPPNSPDCVETADLKYCGGDGVCRGGPAPGC